MRFWPILLWLLYLLSPYDLIPDVIPGIGRIDDIIILGIIYWNFIRKKQPDAENASYGANERNERFDESWSHRASQGSAVNRPARDPYSILGVSRSATLQDIKQAYRVQANRYHPDKVSHLGEEFQALAKEKFQDIQWAYEKLTREKAA